MRVLVVEDDPGVAIPLVEGLRRNGLDVTHVGFAAEVIPASYSADVILLDIELPDGDGISILREMRWVPLSWAMLSIPGSRCGRGSPAPD
jgi:two-component system torCAD operon response regulator TorR